MIDSGFESETFFCTGCGQAMTVVPSGFLCTNLLCRRPLIRLTGDGTALGPSLAKLQAVNRRRIADLLMEKANLAVEARQPLPCSPYRFYAAVHVATHQHKHGGLYLYKGPARAASDGVTRMEFYQHIFPFADDQWYRDPEEFATPGRFVELPK